MATNSAPTVQVKAASQAQANIRDSATQSARESRARTIWAALTRWIAPKSVAELGATSQGELRLVLVGADFVEAKENALEPLERLIECLGKETRVKDLRVALVGPNVPLALQDNVQSHTYENGVTVKVKMDCHLLHESVILDDDEFGAPLFAFLFNAGIWGYDSWLPTLQLLHRRKVVTCVTSYNHLEAEHDQEVIVEESGVDFEWLWGPEPNPFASQVHRPSGIEGQTCADNAQWQVFQASSATIPPQKAQLADTSAP